MRIAAVVFSLAVALVAFEVALRTVPQIISPKLLILFEPGLRSEIASGAFALKKDFRPVERDDQGPPLYVPKPESVIVSIDATEDGRQRSTDEIGFCNPPGRYEGHDRIEVITLGDSFSWCHAVGPEQAWPALLGDRTGLSVFSLGLGGKGLYEYVQLLREFGLAKKPRIVIMNVYGGNDLRDALEYQAHRQAVERGEPPPGDEPVNLAPGLVSSLVGRHSYAINFLVALVSRTVSKGIGPSEKTGINIRYDLVLPGGEVRFNLENRDRDEIVAAQKLDDGRAMLDVWKDALDRFGRMAREHGFTGIVTYTPAAYAAYGDLVRLEDPNLGPLLARFDEAQRSYLARRAPTDGLLFFDLTPALREAASHEDAADVLYGPVHVHLTMRGNKVVAEALARFLQDRGLDKSPEQAGPDARDARHAQESPHG